MIRLISTCFFIICVLNGGCQLSENFNDNEIKINPTWEGNTSDFIVNEDGLLQLNATESNPASIYTKLNDLPDSIQWDIYTEIRLSPSSNNLMRIYLWSDTSDYLNGKAYYIEIGESGNDDAIQLYRQNSGQRMLLGSGKMGAAANNRNTIRIQVKRDVVGFWEVKADYTGSVNLISDFTFFDDEFDLTDGYFVLFCKFSSTRTNNYLFDDIYVGPIIGDTIPPQITSASIIGDHDIQICFSEQVDNFSALDSIAISPDIGPPATIAFQDDGVCINFSFVDSFDENTNYTVTLDNVEDIAGNGITLQVSLYKVSTPEVNDIVINEILFNPTTGGDDFIELYNRSEKILNIKGLIIMNADNNDRTEITYDKPIFPGQYIALSDDIEYIEENFTLLDPDQLVFNTLPGLNNENGNVTLLFEGDIEITIDQVDYDEKMHHAFISNDMVDGISLERKDPNGDSMDPSNWKSASSDAGYATPGYQNSAFGIPAITSQFIIENKVFSPNSNQIDDILTIKYVLSGDSYVLNLKVFDVNGNFVKDLYENELLSVSGELEWNGRGSSNEMIGKGIYILWFELFNPDGDVSYTKKTIVLADFLD